MNKAFKAQEAIGKYLYINKRSIIKNLKMTNQQSPVVKLISSNNQREQQIKKEASSKQIC